jgi:hypothetical protein
MKEVFKRLKKKEVVGAYKEEAFNEPLHVTKTIVDDVPMLVIISRSCMFFEWRIGMYLVDCVIVRV